MLRCLTVPAEVWGEDVDAFVLFQQRMESAPVRAIDAVALFARPEFHLPAKQHIQGYNSCNSYAKTALVQLAI